MAWTAEVRIDPDKQDVGMAAAIWNAGEADEFRFARRERIHTSKIPTFVSNAKAALAARDALLAREATATTTLTTALNTE